MKLKNKKYFLLLVMLLIVLAFLISCGDSVDSTVRDAPKKSSEETPVDFKVAFFGDLGTDTNSIKLLELIKAEGADMALHLGDIDYADDPAGHVDAIERILGVDFPYLLLMGNHDEKRWYGEGGYQKLQAKRLRRIGVRWEGNLGVMSTIRYKGLSIVMTSAGITGWNLFQDEHAKYINDSLKGDDSTWKICAWHKNQHKMQVARKGNETYWGVYEECRKFGAFIVTGHSHTYSRSHLLSSMKNQKIASTSNNLELTPGKSFAVVSGLGGGGRKKRGKSPFSAQYRVPTDPWWASVYTADQGAKNGALFCEFNKGGVKSKAICYFKDIDGKVIDRFSITSGVN